MAITLKRQLNDEEKGIVLRRHGRKCFATGHLIPDSESVHFDHIYAFSRGGESELDNVAPMCEFHNKAKGVLSLEDFRTKLLMAEFFTTGDRLTLKDLLKFMHGKRLLDRYGTPVAITRCDGQLSIEGPQEKIVSSLLKCPTTGWAYFYATLPVALLDSDDDEEHQFGLQPRFLIFEKVFDLYRHFQTHPVLQPSIGRIAGDQILLFDGQHKAAALLWNGRRSIECKVYLEPDVRVLNQTNISAHDKFAQTRFFSSVMVLKLGSQFGKDFEEYKNKEDGQPKTEAGFLSYLDRHDANLSRADRNKRFRSYLYNAVLEDEGNKLSKLVSAGNRSSNEKPLTVDMISKSFFANFLNTDPVSDNMATSAYRRDAEISNNVALMNLFFERSLFSWNPTAPANDETRTKLQRIYSSKSIMAWCEIFKDAICAKLEVTDEEDRARPFYREIPQADWVKIGTMCSRLVNWQMWSAPAGSEIDSQLSNNKTVLKQWLRNKGLTTGFLLGASE